MATWRLPLLRRTLPLISPPPSPSSSSFSPPLTRTCSNSKSVQCSSLSVEESTSSASTHSQIPQTRRNSNWKPMCLYHAQGQCTKTNESLHLEKFCHSWSVNLGEGVSRPNNLREQEFDYFLVLDLEGKVEILELAG